MTIAVPDLLFDLLGLSEQAWLARLDDLGDAHGDFAQLGARHFALSVDAGRDLLVTFGSVEEARRSPGALPRGLDHVTRNGWSVLAFLSRGDTWFRDVAVWRHIDRLTDDGFFEDFDRVLFTGAGPGGYAAAAFSVAAPGARVLAIQPYATLDPAIAGWDRRHLSQRRRDWTSRYGYAPAMLQGASRAWILRDPHQPLDAMHAALFHRPNVTTLPCRHAGPRLDAILQETGALPRLLDLAMESTLDLESFAQRWRARRGNMAYLRLLMQSLEAGGRRKRLIRLCRFGLGTADGPLYARKLAELEPPRAARPSSAAAG